MQRFQIFDYLAGTIFRHRRSLKLYELVRIGPEGTNEPVARLVSLDTGDEFNVPAAALGNLYVEDEPANFCPLPAGRLLIGSVTIEDVGEADNAGGGAEVRRKRGRPKKPVAQVQSYFENKSL